jgi:phage shock protein C
MLAGVAGGLAEILDADPSLVRIVWVVLAIFTGGLALLVYIVMAIVVPEAPAGGSAMPPSGATDPEATQLGASWAADREARRAARRARRGTSGDSQRAGVVGGLILIVIGAFFLIREVVPAFDWNLWWPIGLILLGGVLLVLALLPGRSAD